MVDQTENRSFIGSFFSFLSKSLKYSLLFLGSIFALLIIISVILIRQAVDGSIDSKIPKNSYLFLDLNKKVIEMGNSSPLNFLSGKLPLSLPKILQAIDTAAQDEDIKGIVAYVDAPQMDLAILQEIRAAIERYKNKTDKITIVYANSYASPFTGNGTGVYYLASAFDEVWMQPIGNVATIGMSIETPFVREALDKWNIKPEVFRRKEYKTYMNTFTEKDYTPEHRETTVTLLNGIESQIIDGIAKSREMTPDEVRDLFKNSPLEDKEALKEGFVDRLGYREEVKAYLLSLETETDKNDEEDDDDEIESVKKNEEEVTFLTVGEYLLKKKASKKLDLLSGNLPGSCLIQKGKEGIKPVLLGTIIMDGAIVSDIPDSASPLNDENVGGNYYADVIHEAGKDKNYDAYLIRINSPGGDAVASETIRHALEKLKEKTGKPIYVSMGGVSASGGYWIASMADKIVANPGTITGSIGVILGKFNLKDFLKELGVNMSEISNFENANENSMTQPLSEHTRENKNKSIDFIYKEFTERVAKGRKLSLDHVEEIAQGKPWLGTDALKFGLVDHLGGYHATVDLILKDLKKDPDSPVILEILPKPKHFLDALSMLLDFDVAGIMKTLVEQLTFLKHILSHLGIETSSQMSGVQLKDNSPRIIH